jgi:hypothetical protein
MPKSTAAATAPRAKRTRRTAVSSRRGRRAVTHEQIALRAYELHLAGADGDPVEHWLRAERELGGA